MSCVQCGAALRSDEGFCPLCHSSVERGFDPLTAPLEELEVRGSDGHGEAEGPGDPAGSTDEAFDGLDVEIAALVPTAPMVSTPAPRPALTSMTTPEPSGPADHGVDDLDVMFSILAAQHRQNEPASGLADRLGDRSVRLTVMLAGASVVALLAFIGLAVLGFVL